MANLLHVYMNNPTSGGTDGTAVSEEHAMTAPITSTLTVTAAAGAEVAIKCALRCDSGYQTTGDIALSLSSYDSTTKTYTTGYAGGKVKLAADNSYADSAAALAGATWADTLTISDVVGSANKIFWVKLVAAAGDTPIKDGSIAVHHEETIEAVA